MITIIFATEAEHAFSAQLSQTEHTTPPPPMNKKINKELPSFINSIRVNVRILD